MDSQRFDNLTAALAPTHTRRSALHILSAVSAVFLTAQGGDPALAKKRRKKRKPTCTDDKQNGLETDIDCGGGACRRCATGQRCLAANDCASGACMDEQCVTCTPSQLCGSDVNGACRCDQPFPSGDPVCNSAQALGLTVDDCAKCPAGTETCVTINGLLFNCYQRCGSAQ
jgi:hypothetical protein